MEKFASKLVMVVVGNRGGYVQAAVVGGIRTDVLM